jgi:hypothetical protein
MERVQILAENAIATMKMDIDQYLSRPNTNKEYANRRLNHLMAIREYILLLERMQVELEIDRKQAYQEGFNAGYEKATKNYEFLGFNSFRELDFFKPQASRSISIERAQARWPELY